MDVQSCLVVWVEGPNYLGEPVGMAFSRHLEVYCSTKWKCHLMICFWMAFTSCRLCCSFEQGKPGTSLPAAQRCGSANGNLSKYPLHVLWQHLVSGKFFQRLCGSVDGILSRYPLHVLWQHFGLGSVYGNLSRNPCVLATFFSGCFISTAMWIQDFV